MKTKYAVMYRSSVVDNWSIWARNGPQNASPSQKGSFDTNDEAMEVIKVLLKQFGHLTYHFKIEPYFVREE